jgi:FKBP-type peptidyl-prolyl cis-trans isomerase
MNWKLPTLVSAAALLVACNQPTGEAPAPAATEPSLETTEQRTAYALGTKLGEQMQAQEVDVDIASFVAGIEDQMAGGELRIGQEEIASLMSEYQAAEMVRQQERMAQMQQEMEALASTNREAAAQFFEENAAAEGVMTTESGLQYKVLEAGEGPSPGPTDRVTVHYAGTLLDGTQFDSSYDRGSPATFALNQVIAGWTEGLQLMQEGAKYQFYIPSELAYGSRPRGDVIGPDAALVFTVELLDVEQEEGQDGSDGAEG